MILPKTQYIQRQEVGRPTSVSLPEPTYLYYCQNQPADPTPTRQVVRALHGVLWEILPYCSEETFLVLQNILFFLRSKAEYLDKYVSPSTRLIGSKASHNIDHEKNIAYCKGLKVFVCIFVKETYYYSSPDSLCYQCKDILAL